MIFFDRLELPSDLFEDNLQSWGLFLNHFWKPHIIYIMIDQSSLLISLSRFHLLLPEKSRPTSKTDFLSSFYLQATCLCLSLYFFGTARVLPLDWLIDYPLEQRICSTLLLERKKKVRKFSGMVFVIHSFILYFIFFSSATPTYPRQSCQLCVVAVRVPFIHLCSMAHRQTAVESQS